MSLFGTPTPSKRHPAPVPGSASMAPSLEPAPSLEDDIMALEVPLPITEKEWILGATDNSCAHWVLKILADPTEQEKFFISVAPGNAHGHKAMSDFNEGIKILKGLAEDHCSTADKLMTKLKTVGTSIENRWNAHHSRTFHLVSKCAGR